MSPLEIGRPPRRAGFFRNIFIVVVIVGVVVGGYFVIPRFEWKAPQIKITPDADTLGIGPIDIEVTEQGSGLRSIAASLSANGTEYPLISEQYEQPVMHKKLSIAVASKLTGVKEGPAVLRVNARDRSWWSFFRGNQTSLQKNVMIDITPPTLELIADDRYINFGGVGMVVYKPSADTVATGVKIGKYVFPGYKGQTKDRNSYMVLFAHPYNVGENEKAVLFATDRAGNSREMKLVYELKNVRYKKSTIPISDDFIQNKVAPLLQDVAGRQGSSKDVFIKVNHGVREENENKIRSITQQSTPAILWSGAFSQLSNSKVEANFADARTYIYKNESIDNAYHLGYDLSVTKQYPAEAANSGQVAFIGDLGIYGNTVIIDHGLGLFTLYSHLSSIDVKAGDKVSKQQPLGKTGETGLAAGDHMHYGVYLAGVPVLPVEWWDQKWINDNIQPKLDGSSNEVSEAPKASKPTHRAARKRRG